MSIVAKLVRKFRNLINLPSAYMNNIKHRNSVKGKPVENVFTEIYQNNFWGDDESVSGSGSNEEQTRVIVNEIPGILIQYKVESMLDLPCGDFNWMRKLDLSKINYTGGDIVEQIVEKNNARYKKPNIVFKKLNVITDELPKVDLMLCRDCFIHLSNEQVKESIANIKKQNIRYLLTTSYTNRTNNKNIVAGEWRPINLQVEPFNLKPLQIINENCTEDGGRWSDKSLLLIDLSKY